MIFSRAQSNYCLYDLSEMSKLDEADILRRSKADSLSVIKSLQCWGMKLKDVSILEGTPNLEILNLSCNELKTLKSLRKCLNVNQLYLRKNEITDLEELKHLQGMTELKILWLAGNPIASFTNYRISVLNLLPQLQQLDQTVITDEERQTVVSKINKETEEQSHLCSAIFSLLPLMNKESLNTVYTQLHTMLNEESQ